MYIELAVYPYYATENDKNNFIYHSSLIMPAWWYSFKTTRFWKKESVLITKHNISNSVVN